jgi:hypothetical protein
MARPSEILRTTTFEHFAHIHRALRAVEMRQYISKTQGDEIAHGVDNNGRFPVDVSLVQRTPKGTVYVYIDDTLTFQIDQRGAFSRPGRELRVNT